MTRPLVLLLLLTIIAVAQPPRYIVVGSWNIENLDGHRSQAPEALARHLALAGADIVALQEIHDTGIGLSNKRLDRALKLLNQEGEEWQYRLFPNKPPNEKQRLCGIAWNARKLEPVGEPLRLDITDDPNDDYAIWHRHPHAMKFQVRGDQMTDFVLIPIHMKSNRRPKGKDEFFTRRQRGLEASTLAEQLPRVQQHFGEEHDIIIAGDTNCLDVSEPGLANYRAAGLKDLNLLDFSTHTRGRSPFDRFFVPSSQPEFESSAQIVLRPTDQRAFDEAKSDHFLILTTFDVMADDDGRH